MAYGVLPSDLLGLERGSHAAYCYNEAIYLWAQFIQTELDSVKGKNEKAVQRGREAKLKQLLSDGKVAGRFRDPAAKG